MLFQCCSNRHTAACASVLLLVLYSLPLYSQEPTFDSADIRVGLYGGSGRETIHDMAEAPDGGYFLVGHTSSKDFRTPHFGRYSGETSAIVFRIDRDGKRMWSRSIGGSSNEAAFAVRALPSGGAMVLVWSSSEEGPAEQYATGDRFALWLFGLDADGKIAWGRHVATPYHVLAWDMTATEDGGCLLGGSVVSDSSEGYGNTDACLIKVDGLGNEQWRTMLRGVWEDRIVAVTGMRDGGYAAVAVSYCDASSGCTNEDAERQEISVMRVDNDGDVVWRRVIGGLLTENASDIAETADNGVVIVGHRIRRLTGPRASDIRTLCYGWAIRLDAAGEQVWDWDYGGQGNHLSTVSTTPDGTMIVSGDVEGGWSKDGRRLEDTLAGDSSEVHNLWLASLDETGDIAWGQAIAGTSHIIVRQSMLNCDGTLVLSGERCYPAILNGVVTKRFEKGHTDGMLLRVAGVGRPCHDASGPKGSAIAIEWTLHDGEADSPDSASIAGADESDGHSADLEALSVLVHPNPARSAVTFILTLLVAGHARLDISDGRGRHVETLIDGEIDAGGHRVLWSTEEISSGRYFYRLTCGERIGTGILTIVR